MNTSRDLDLEKQIDAYIKGRLNEQKVEDLWIELLKRPSYIHRLETELSIKLIIEEQLEAEQEQAVPTSIGASSKAAPAFMNSWKWLAVAASVAILVIALNFFTLDSRQNIQQLTLGNINLVENLAAPEVMRSQGVSPSTELDSLLNLGFKAAISGDKDRALEIYDQVIRDFGDNPKSAMAHLNVGIISYNAQDYETATAAFTEAIDRVQNDQVLEEKAYWYLGNTYINTGQLVEARTAIEHVYAFEGIYHKPASRLLQKLDEELNMQGAE